MAATAAATLAAPAAGALEVSTTEPLDAARAITPTDETSGKPAALPAANYSPLDVSEPVLRSGSSFERTDWGFKHVDLALPTHAQVSAAVSRFADRLEEDAPRIARLFRDLAG